MVLLVIIAVVIVWVAIRNVLEKGEEGISLDAFLLSFDIQNVAVFTSEIDGNDKVDVSVKRNSGRGSFSEIRFVLSDGTSSESFDEPTSIQEIGVETFTLTLTEVQGEDIIELTIAPKGDDKVGKITNTFRITDALKTCIDTCDSWGYNCGLPLICGEHVMCGLCEDPLLPNCVNYICRNGI